MKKLIIIPAVVATIAGMSMLYANTISAKSAGKPFETMAQEIAQRFNLNVDEVNSFFAEKKAERETERTTIFAAKLDEAVTKGIITTEQKNLLIAKKQQEHEEFEANKDSLDNLTKEERQAKMEEHRQEMDTWAAENGIDLDQLRTIIGPTGEGRNGQRPGRM